MRPNFNLKFAEFYIYWSVNNARNPKKKHKCAKQRKLVAIQRKAESIYSLKNKNKNGCRAQE